MAIADDFSIALNGDIRHTSGTTQYTVLELHRFLQDNADNASAATADDLINITSDDPSSRATDQIITLLGSYNIDDTAAQFLYGGSIRQGSGATEVLYSGLQVVGTVNTAATEIDVVQNNAVITNYWGNGNNSSGSILNRILVKSRLDGRDIDARQIRVQAREYNDGNSATDTYAEFSVTLGEGESVAAIFTNNDLNNDTLRATTIAYDKHDNVEGFQAIDIGSAAGTENYYSQWEITGTGTSPTTPNLKSLFEYTKAVTARGSTTQIHGMDGELFRGITHSIAYDTDSGTWTQNEEVAWGTTMAYDNGVGVPFTVGEKLTFGTSGAVGTLLKGGSGATGEMVVAIEPGTGTVVNDEQITGASSGATADVDGTTRLVDTGAIGGTGALLAIDDGGATGVMYIQLLTGSAPVNDLPLHGITSDTEAVVNVTVTPRTISPNSFLGTFTGSSLIGAYGIGMKPGDTTSSDLFFPLDSDPSGVSPPNNVNFFVNGLVSGDRVMVGLDGGGGAFDTTQMTTNATYSSTTTTIDVVSIPAHTPQVGNIRVITDGGTHILATYTAHNGTTQFTGVTADFTGDTATSGNNAYLTYIDKAATGTSENFSTIFTTGDITLRARVREGSTPGSEIKEATGTGTLSNTGGSININRIADT